MKKLRSFLPYMLFAAILLGSCAGQAPEATPTPDIGSILTQSVGTFAAAFFETQTALVPPATPTPLDTPTPLPTTTPLALPSPLPSATIIYYTAIVYPSVTPTGTQYTPTANPATLASGCNNLSLISDVTIPSGTEMKPEQAFTKTWKVANTGTCDWTLSYRVVFVSGTDMGAAESRPRNIIAPGKWTQLDVQMVAPKKPGTYTGYWKLADGAGKIFGSLLGATIVVKDTSYP